MWRRRPRGSLSPAPPSARFSSGASGASPRRGGAGGPARRAVASSPRGRVAPRPRGANAARGARASGRGDARTGRPAGEGPGGRSVRSKARWLAGSLRFAPRIALRRVLHRCRSQEIRCWGLCSPRRRRAAARWVDSVRVTRKKAAGAPGGRGRGGPGWRPPSHHPPLPRRHPPGRNRAVGMGALAPRRGARPPADSPNDPSAGSPTETLLRLLLPLGGRVRTASRPRGGRRRPPPGPVRRPHRAARSVVATGGVYNGQGRSRRGLMTRAY